MPNFNNNSIIETPVNINTIDEQARPLRFGQFKLRARVFVSDNLGSIDYFDNKVDEFNLILKNYNINGIDDAVGESYTFITTATPSANDISRKLWSDHTDLNGDDNYIGWNMVYNMYETQSLYFVYENDFPKEYEPIPLKARCIDIIKWNSYVFNGVYYNSIPFLNDNEEEREQQIFIYFTSGIDLRADMGNTDPYKTPFHIEGIEIEGYMKYFLCLNPKYIVSASFIDSDITWNGGNWECSIVICDEDYFYYYKNKISSRKLTLELPSVYKPFYMRSLVLINNRDFNSRIVGNVFNGIGYRDTNGNYNVGKLTASINETSYTIDITRNKPTLLCGYDESINEFTTRVDENREALNGAVTSLSNINVAINMTESMPSDDGTFLSETLSYANTVSFYKINYTTTIAGGHYSIIFNENSPFSGQTSTNVKYFFVSEHFWKKIYNKENDVTYVMCDVMCNKSQEYELNPHKRTPSDSDNNFLSVYGTIFFESYAMYAAYVGVAGGNDPDPSTNSIIIQIDVDSIINGDVRRFNFFTESEWMIIGITDPLVDLVGSNAFSEERKNGTILTPHKDFVTVMTFAQGDGAINTNS